MIERDRIYGFENDTEAKLSCFLNTTLRSIGRRYRTAMIVLPGGGYSKIQEREAEPVAIRYQGYGLQCFVLQYSVARSDCYIKALKQLGESIALIRKNSERWDIDPERIVLCGFSAGAHLAASLGCYWKQISEWLSVEVYPNALLLGYPVVTAGKFCHRESVNNCLSQKFGVNEDVLSIEKNIGEEMPPVFLWACAEDKEVSVQNALLLAEELSKKQIPYELHVFSGGGHGYSLGDECSARIEEQINERYAGWVPLSLDWLGEVM